MEAHLPPAVLHRGGNDDLESQVHPAAALGHVAETGRHFGSLQGLGGHHLSARLIAHGIHDDHLTPVEILDNQRVLNHFRQVQVAERAGDVGNGQYGAGLSGTQPLHLAIGTATRKQQRRQDTGTGQLTPFHLIRIHRSAISGCRSRDG